MRNRKLFVGGCSVSDYTNVETTYGEMLSKMLNFEYVHEAAGCGSNWRIWRTITNHILNGNLTSDDLLIIQYTNFERREFWSRHQAYTYYTGYQPLREKYANGDGDIIRFKVKSHEWQITKEEKLLHSLYENNFVSSEFDFDVFCTQHLMFQCLLKEYGIKTIFMPLEGYVGWNIKYIPYFENSVINLNEEWRKNEFHNITDLAHLNSKGHQHFANLLYNFIQTNYFNELPELNDVKFKKLI